VDAIKAVSYRHGAVDNHDMRLLLQNLLDGFFAGWDYTANFPAWVQREKRANIRMYGEVVTYNQDLVPIRHWNLYQFPPWKHANEAQRSEM
jgi:hypothetical protein